MPLHAKGKIMVRKVNPLLQSFYLHFLIFKPAALCYRSKNSNTLLSNFLVLRLMSESSVTKCLRFDATFNSR